MTHELVESFAINHRAHALLTLKAAKVKRPAELRYGLWDGSRL